MNTFYFHEALNFASQLQSFQLAMLYFQPSFHNIIKPDNKQLIIYIFKLPI